MEGIQWPVVDGKESRSTTPTSTAIWAASFAAMGEKKLAKAAAAETKWRFKYADFVRQHVVASLKSPEAALAGAKAGLAEAHKRFEIELTVPYNGKELRGSELLAQLKTWETNGTIEPSCCEALSTVVRTKKWVDLSDRYFVMLGAGSAMGPYPLLMQLGANVIAIDLNRAPIWERLIKIARESCGTLHFPLTVPQASLSDDAALAAHAGGDLLCDAPRLARWLCAVEPARELTVGSYVYLDGEAHVRLVLACDAIVQAMIAQRRVPISLAFLCTPTDDHVIPSDAWQAARDAQQAFSGPRLVKMLLTPFSRRMLASNTAPEVQSADGDDTFHYVDAIVVAQGPNYALAKRMQHWRAIVARDAGCVVSSNIAPSTSTVSVTSNRQFAWAYDGMSFFPAMEIFRPETSHHVMTGMLIWDLRNKNSVSHPSTQLRNPLELFASGAFHGGVWRTPYKFDSVGEVAVVVHFVKVLLPYLLLLLVALLAYNLL